ncbi:MAG: hypothetical protein COB67_02360 [SAR324 cluster bacterium]|uniref:Uncharacterized protein n=1 Tax=SAR324 cluster bacterium TaxID=2024889 RepID=A0A2A4T9D8_9DELT|nr:MAG: hypothetical protein COB67_02360 [SAR324 cluster bacterium]
MLMQQHLKNMETIIEFLDKGSELAESASYLKNLVSHHINGNNHWDAVLLTATDAKHRMLIEDREVFRLYDDYSEGLVEEVADLVESDLYGVC